MIGAQDLDLHFDLVIARSGEARSWMTLWRRRLFDWSMGSAVRKHLPLSQLMSSVIASEVLRLKEELRSMASNPLSTNAEITAAMMDPLLYGTELLPSAPSA